MPHFAVDADMATRLLDEAIDHGKSKPGAFAILLCRKEWGEYFFQQFRRHADAVIRNGNQHVVSRNDFWMLVGIFLVQINHLGFNHQQAAIGHGIARIDRQIQNG